MQTYEIRYKLGIFPCHAFVRASNKQEADCKFVEQYQEVPESILLVEEDPISKNTEK